MLKFFKFAGDFAILYCISFNANMTLSLLMETSNAYNSKFNVMVSSSIHIID